MATFVERKSGFLLAQKLDKATADAFAQSAAQSFSTIKEAYAKTLTLDNGPEMAYFERIERQTPLRVYFATPYHSWERGSNENTNGLWRFYFPKKTSFAKLTQKELDIAVKQINTRPRKRLGYKTPEQMLKRCDAIRTGI